MSNGCRTSSSYSSGGMSRTRVTAIPITGKASSGGNVRNKRMGLMTVCLSVLACERARRGNVPGGGHDVVAHEQKLRDDAEDVEMHAESE
jgi:hypothetical protein